MTPFFFNFAILQFFAYDATLVSATHARRAALQEASLAVTPRMLMPASIEAASESWKDTFDQNPISEARQAAEEATQEAARQAAEAADAATEYAAEGIQEGKRVTAKALDTPVARITTAVTGGAVKIGTLAFAPGVLKPGEPIPIAGHSAHTRMVVAVVILTIAIAVPLMSDLLEWMVARFFPQWAPRKGRPSAGVAALLLVSYALLIPGLLTPLFSLNMVIKVQGIRFGFKSDEKGNAVGFAESFYQIMGELLELRAFLAILLLVFYAVLIPLLKLVLLGIGEYWRFSNDSSLRKKSRAAVEVVQLVSKWAAPDMFAYMLCLVVFLDLNDPPTITSVGHLDLGFTCFCFFCVCSAWSSCFIPLPEDAEEPSGQHAAVPSQPSFLSVHTGLAIPLATASLALLAYGVSSPCLSMRCDKDIMSKSNPIIKGFLGGFDFSADVSLTQSIMFFSKSFLATGDLNALLSFVLITAFVIALPAIDVFFLLWVAYRWSTPGQSSARVAMSVSSKIQHLAMLDVFIAGVVVIVLACGTFQEQGIMLFLKPGMGFLFMAEVVRLSLRTLVRHHVEAVADGQSK
jgi:hypothetical protein